MKIYNDCEMVRCACAGEFCQGFQEYTDDMIKVDGEYWLPQCLEIAQQEADMELSAMN